MKTPFEMLVAIIEMQEANYGNATNTHLDLSDLCREAKDVIKNYNLSDVIRCPSCGSKNEYSQGFKQNIQPVDGGDWRQVCFNICDKCGHAIDVWFWD